MINKRWLKVIDKIDFAFQPIVCMESGVVLGYEALLRNYEKAGFKTIDDFFDLAYTEKVLFKVDVELRKKALKKIKPVYDKNNKIIIFFNLDNRIIEMDDYQTGLTSDILLELGLPENFITFEVSEKYEFESFIKAKTVLNLYIEQGFNVALDDFGTGYSGLKMLYNLNPKYIKIDRFSISDIVNDRRKRLYVTNIVNIAHQSNIQVIAEGVETLDEFHVCEEVGCDFVQGYFIQKPTTEITKLKKNYLKKKIKRKILLNNNFNLDDIYYSSNIYNDLIDKYIISSSTDCHGIITSVTSAFCYVSGYSRQELIGKSHNMVRHKDMNNSIFKELWSTVRNGNIWDGEIKNMKKNGESYWVEVKIIPNFNTKGEIIGFTSLRQDITDRKIVNIDYLTNVWNKKYFDYILEKTINDLKDKDRFITLALIDIDNFKAYNDYYGHKKGDEALQLLTSCISKLLKKEEYLFRVGGEEFAILIIDKNQDEILELFDEIFKHINDLEIEHKKNNKVSEYMTISCGIICTESKKIKKNTNLFVNADILLYEAKNSGKNKIEISSKLYNSSLNLKV